MGAPPVAPYTVTGKTITVNGTSGDDTIDIENDGITLNGKKTNLDMTQYSTVIVKAGKGNDTVTNNLASDNLKTFKANLGDGNDKLYSYSQGLKNLEANGGKGDDTIDLSNSTATKVTVGGGAGDDAIYGTAGSDNLSGGAGNDTVYGFAGDDKIKGGAGNDTLYGGGGKDKISGGAGNDTIYGDADDDKLAGGADDDTIYGGSGNDTITGDTGTNNLFGGTGTNTYQGTTSSDTINDDTALDNDHQDLNPNGTTNWADLYAQTNPYYTSGGGPYNQAALSDLQTSSPSWTQYMTSGAGSNNSYWWTALSDPSQTQYYQ